MLFIKKFFQFCLLPRQCIIIELQFNPIRMSTSDLIFYMNPQGTTVYELLQLNFYKLLIFNIFHNIVKLEVLL